jgi:ribulose-5-phosphate 4-epimerase/fuculose-1-phosphate aldolase
MVGNVSRHGIFAYHTSVHAILLSLFWLENSTIPSGALGSN